MQPEDPHGSPKIGRRAAAIMRDAQLEASQGRHAPPWTTLNAAIF
jgi:hypothetical protein